MSRAYRSETGWAADASGSTTTAVPKAMISVMTSLISDVSKPTERTAFAPKLWAC